METARVSLDPHQRPPASIRNVYKKYQKLPKDDLHHNSEIIDSHNCDDDGTGLSLRKQLNGEVLKNLFDTFKGGPISHYPIKEVVNMYEVGDLPGLFIIPSLLPPEIQTILLCRLLHRDLSNPAHLTNIHTHYNLNYPPNADSFFQSSPDKTGPVAIPLDPSIHRPICIKTLLTRKLRWVTLGGQYNWTEKKYPELTPPEFPADIKALLDGIFPDTKSEAAIVNLYSPGDTLSMHRDVAEECDKGLISISLGCDAIFTIGNATEDHDQISSDDFKARTVVLRLHSGDAVYMSGMSRFAWHGVPQILAGTCPPFLQEWPAGEVKEDFEDWRGWMSNKRINLNVRQMRETV